MTPAELRAFQESHGDHLGAPLSVDGILGLKTEWALDFATLAPERRASVGEAQRWLGLKEDPEGSNSDPDGIIGSWLARCLAKPGDPWCAAAVSRWLGTVKIAGAQALGRHLPPTLTPLPGDVMWYPTTGGKGHCGIVTGLSLREVMTIEGNLKNAVRCVRRPRSSVMFSRAFLNTDGQCPGVIEKGVSLELGGSGTR